MGEKVRTRRDKKKGNAVMQKLVFTVIKLVWKNRMISVNDFSSFLESWL